MTKPRIAIVGRGNVAMSLERGAEQSGYSVRTTSHDPSEVRAAGAWGEVVVLAVPASAREAAIRSLGDLTGKVVIDPTNLVNPDLSYAGEAGKSGAEQVQEWAKGARVVKAFNTVFAELMDKGNVDGDPVGLFVAGDDPDAKEVVLQLGRDIGFQAIDCGPLRSARSLEPLAVLTIQLGRGPRQLGTDFGFKLVGVGPE